MQHQEWCEKIKSSLYFNEAWYRARYRDVNVSDLPAAEHFLCVGARLSRNPGPNFDTEFYESAYTIRHPSKHALLDYLESADRSERPITAKAWAKIMKDLRKRTSKEWGELQKGLKVSYCTPVKNRLSDIQSTLKTNLAEHKDLQDEVEFIIVLFDEDDESYDWIMSECADAIETGLLRVIKDRTTLDTWHFGKAKNAFRPHAKGRYYSSLDGDNFVSRRQTELLFELMEAHPYGFVFHHFSGRWGDGSSGRVTLPTAVYRDVGYDPKLLPRQFDEVDMILGALKAYPAMPIVCHDPARNFLSLSMNARDFWENEALPNKQLFVPAPYHRVPLNQRGEGYDALTPTLKPMNNLNSALSALNRAPSSRSKTEYMTRVKTNKYALLDAFEGSEAIGMLFETPGGVIPPCDKPEGLSLFACVHNEEAYLPKFVAHYRKLGVKNFFFVDDHSYRPVAELDLGPDVHVFRPKVGQFKTLKTLWIESLMRVFVSEGDWVLVTDADEFIDLPKTYNSFHDLTKALDKTGQESCVGLLLDLLPAPDVHVSGEEEFDKLLTHFCYRTDNPPLDYTALRPIQWAFGSYADISWRVDMRYHSFGTVDSMRKFPLFRLSQGRHLNQGFHTIHPSNGSEDPSPDVWKSNGPILPIFHYKLAKLFSETARSRAVAKSVEYHERTAANIVNIFGNSAEDTLQKTTAISAWLRPASDALLPGLFDTRMDAEESEGMLG